MKYRLLLIFLINTLIGYSQEIIVEKIKLVNTVDKSSVSEIPRVKDLVNGKNPVVKKINAMILDRFMINSFKQEELEEFRWSDVEFISEMKEKILFISFSGEYYGAYPNYIEDELFFNLVSGELLKPSIIPFQALFTLSGYFDFLNKYWLSGVKDEFKAAIECANFEPYCSYYDIYSYTIDDNKLSISLVNDCYPHVSHACSPGYEISVQLDSVKRFLNELGIYILVESNYLSMSPIDKIVENEILKDKVQNNIFLFGRIDDKYPVSIAINVNNQGLISGYYYYDKKLQKLTLSGQLKDNIYLMVEHFDNKQTGFLEFKISDKYDPKEFSLYDPNGNSKYLIGKWMNPDKTKIFDIKFTEVKTMDKN